MYKGKAEPFVKSHLQVSVKPEIAVAENPIDKIIDLYDRILHCEKEKNDLLEQFISMQNRSKAKR